MPCGATVCGPRVVCGGLILSSIGICVLTLTASFVVPDKISAEIKKRVEASVQISSQEKFLDKAGSQDNEAVITVFNLTNAKAVLGGKEKPNFLPIKLGFDVHTERYDPVFVNASSAVEYKSWTKYTVKAADKDLYEKGTLVVPNAQYIAGVYQKFGGESTMQMALIFFVVKKVSQAYTSAVPILFQFSALPAYLSSISKSLVDQGVFTSQNQVVLQWALSNQVHGTSLKENLTASNPALSEQVQGFEMDQPMAIPASKRLNATEASKLWAMLADQRATADLIAWYSCAAALAMKQASPAEFSQCVKAGTPGEKIIGLFGSDASLAGEKMAFLLRWLMALLNSQAYLKFFKAGVVPNVTAAQPAASFAEIGLLQFGSGEVSKALFNKTSVDSLGILPKQLKGPLELPACPACNPAIPPLSISQAREFLDVFSVRANVTRFLLAVSAYRAGNPGDLASIMPLYQKTGLNTQTAGPYALYLSKHLVARVLVHGLIHGGGPMDADGVYPSNSGMFCRLTPKQVLEGWTDPLISQVESTPYYGILGEQFPSKKAKDAKKGGAQEYGVSTGVGSASGRITLWKGITKFRRRDELPEGSCSDSYTTHVRRDNCTAWTREEVIAGSGSGAFLEPFDGKIKHGTYKSATTGSATARIWNGDLFRNIEISRTGTVTSRDVRLEHFSLSEKTWLGDCSAGGECNAANQDYRMSEGDAVYPLETVRKGIPVALSMPYFLTPRGLRSDIRQCMNDSSFPRTYREEEHGMYWRFEPLSGAIAEAASVRQVNLQVKKSRYNTLHPAVFTAMGCDDAFFPLAIAEGRKTIGGSLRDDILHAYRVVVIGHAVSITCYAVSAICLVVAVVLAIYLVRSREKGQQQTAKTDTNASPEELPVVEGEVPVNIKTGFGGSPATGGRPLQESPGDASTSV